MNDTRRKELREILKAINDTREKLQAVIEDEEFFLNTAPDNLRNSMRYTRSEEIIESLNDSIVGLFDAEIGIEDSLE